jgi:hypothetical protein
MENVSLLSIKMRAETYDLVREEMDELRCMLYSELPFGATIPANNQSMVERMSKPTTSS